MCIIARRRPPVRLFIKWRTMTDILSTGQFIKKYFYTLININNLSKESSMLGHVGRHFSTYDRNIEIITFDYFIAPRSTLNLGILNTTWYNFNVRLEANNFQSHLLPCWFMKQTSFARRISFIIIIENLEGPAQFVAWFILSWMSLWNS